jgi:von Willebrand factor type D domain
MKYDGQYVRYDTIFGLSVAFDGQWSITVNVPTTLHVGQMCGMCGNNDNNADNDLTTADGTYVGNLPNAGNLVGDSYVVADPTQINSRYRKILGDIY